MNPLITIMNAIKYLSHNTPPEFRNQGRSEAFTLLKDIYQKFNSEHRAARDGDMLKNYDSITFRGKHGL